MTFNRWENVTVRIGVFGGSFDPIHYGHLLLAEQCREQAELDQVLFLPSSISPFKENGPVASKKNRLEMLSLALAGHTPFEISLLETERGGISYTVDTMRDLAAQMPNSELFLLMGADTLQGFPDWKEPANICSLAVPLVASRPGIDTVNLEILAPYATPQQMELIREHQIQTLQLDISSSDIRLRARQSKSIRYQLPRSVEKYIETKKLYQDKKKR